MTLLENYLDKYEKDQSLLSASIYSMYKDFEYKDEDKFIIDLDFMLENIYNIKIKNDKTEIRRKRMGQGEFRVKILEHYNNTCIVTGNDCIDELEACHIIPVATNEDYSLENGLLLAKNIHATFDIYKWSINPNTFKIEGMNTGTIKKYIGMVLPLNDIMREYIIHHYHQYKNQFTL